MLLCFSCWLVIIAAFPQMYSGKKTARESVVEGTRMEPTREKRGESFHGCLGLLVSCIRVSGCSQFEYLSSLFFLLSLNVTGSRDVAETRKSLFHVCTTWCFENVSTNLNLLCRNYSPCLFCVISDFISSRLMSVKLQKHITLLKKNIQARTYISIYTKWCFKNEDKTFLYLSSYHNFFIPLNNNTPRKLGKTFSKYPVRDEQFPSTQDEIQFRKPTERLVFRPGEFRKAFSVK